MAMPRFARPCLLVATLAAFTGAPASRAQTAAAPASPPVQAAPEPVRPKPRSVRAISPELAASLAASMPKYSPPKPAEKAPDEDDVDLRDIDKPRNQIIRLPKYVVQEDKPPVFRERDINTAKGLGSIAIRRYLSEADLALNRFKLPFIGASNEARALAMYAEDERLQNMADLNETARTTSKVDPAAGEYLRRATQDTYYRAGDFGWRGGPK